MMKTSLFISAFDYISPHPHFHCHIINKLYTLCIIDRIKYFSTAAVELFWVWCISTINELMIWWFITLYSSYLMKCFWRVVDCRKFMISFFHGHSVYYLISLWACMWDDLISMSIPNMRKILLFARTQCLLLFGMILMIRVMNLNEWGFNLLALHLKSLSK